MFPKYTLREVSKYGDISGPYFPVFGLNTFLRSDVDFFLKTVTMNFTDFSSNNMATLLACDASQNAKNALSN